MSAPLKVLFLQSTSEIGGSDIALLRIVESLGPRFKACVVLPSDGPMVPSFRKAGAGIFIVSEMLPLTSRRGVFYPVRYLLNYPRAVWKLILLIRSENIGLVHTNSLHNLYGFLAARLAGVPHIWHVREIVMQNRLALEIERRLARGLSTKILAVSDAVTEPFRNRSGESPVNLLKLEDSVDLDRFHPRNDGRRIREELGIPIDAPLAGIVCRLDHWKAVDVFLRAALLCRRELPSARFLIVGGSISGQEERPGELHALASDLGLGGSVCFAGWRYGPDEMPFVHAALDVLVVASRWPEPFGLSLIEAMASGKPVVATNHGGPVEICADGKTALLVPPEDPEAMAQAMLALLNDPARAREMGAVGRRRAEALYDARDAARELEAIYEQVVA